MVPHNSFPLEAAESIINDPGSSSANGCFWDEDTHINMQRPLFCLPVTFTQGTWAQHVFSNKKRLLLCSGSATSPEPRQVPAWLPRWPSGFWVRWHDSQLCCFIKVIKAKSTVYPSLTQKILFYQRLTHTFENQAGWKFGPVVAWIIQCCWCVHAGAQACCIQQLQLLLLLEDDSLSLALMLVQRVSLR